MAARRLLYAWRVGKRDSEARKRLGDRKWSGLEPMLEEYAKEAVAIARVDFHEELDWNVASVDRLERMLNRLCPAPEPLPPADGDWWTLLWGSWFGELLRRLHGGHWAMSVYPGSDLAVPTLEMENGPERAISRLYPTVKVHRRLTLGAGESLPAFYSMLSARLAAGRGQTG